MKNHQEEIEILTSISAEKQRDFLVNLLVEEKENIEHFKSQNIWVEERVQIIDSLLQMLNVID